ncbi:MAG: hypothetical protein ACI9HJ_000738, partial [Ulvibacter sp.]
SEQRRLRAKNQDFYLFWLMVLKVFNWCWPQE